MSTLSQLRTCLGPHIARSTVNIFTSPRLLLRLGHRSIQVRNANIGKRVVRNPGKSPDHGHILRYNIPKIDIMHYRKRVRVVFIVRVLTVRVSHPQNVLHRFQIHVPNKYLLHVASAPGGCFYTHGRLGVEGVDVVGSDVFDSARHLAAEGNGGRVGRIAGDPLDAEALGWPPEFDSFYTVEYIPFSKTR
ncbi:UDP-N-acetylglucosamine1-carboxyvinyltransferase [Striga asiatica]|uniref:UDP-N-acetylglucosamine1-carboxyvinyltransferase n=1 Tax=Striga asiatica TaxID=4170 RepID=A0A5A7QP43_STRAF|nr:UDP-N-acetylglucosamine1-carboxyvinyltransferase [Striga asiatica]